MTTLTCLRCEHSWTNRTEPSECCPNCKNYNYDQPATKIRQKNMAEGVPAMGKLGQVWSYATEKQRDQRKAQILKNRQTLNRIHISRRVEQVAVARAAKGDS